MIIKIKLNFIYYTYITVLFNNKCFLYMYNINNQRSMSGKLLIESNEKDALLNVDWLQILILLP